MKCNWLNHQTHTSVFVGSVKSCWHAAACDWPQRSRGRVLLKHSCWLLQTWINCSLKQFHQLYKIKKPTIADASVLVYNVLGSMYWRRRFIPDVLALTFCRPDVLVSPLLRRNCLAKITFGNGELVPAKHRA